MAWIYLFLAGLMEIAWAVALKQSEGFSRLLPSTVAAMAMIASFCLLNLAMKTLPLGTAYGVWTGIGAAGTFVFGVVFLDEPISITRVAAIICIVGGVALMRISAAEAAV